MQSEKIRVKRSNSHRLIRSLLRVFAMSSLLRSARRLFRKSDTQRLRSWQQWRKRFLRLRNVLRDMHTSENRLCSVFRAIEMGVHLTTCVDWRPADRRTCSAQNPVILRVSAGTEAGTCGSREPATPRRSHIGVKPTVGTPGSAYRSHSGRQLQRRRLLRAAE